MFFLFEVLLAKKNHNQEKRMPSGKIDCVRPQRIYFYEMEQLSDLQLFLLKDSRIIKKDRAPEP
jgi:hypothetical protein